MAQRAGNGTSGQALIRSGGPAEILDGCIGGAVIIKGFNIVFCGAVDRALDDDIDGVLINANISELAVSSQAGRRNNLLTPVDHERCDAAGKIGTGRAIPGSVGAIDDQQQVTFSRIGSGT